MKNNKKSLIEQLYEGSFSPCEHILSRDPEYRPTCREADQVHQALRKRLGEEDQKRLDQLHDLDMHICSMEACACFSNGFRYGALLMLEIVAGEDALTASP